MFCIQVNNASVLWQMQFIWIYVLLFQQPGRLIHLFTANLGEQLYWIIEVCSNNFYFDPNMFDSCLMLVWLHLKMYFRIMRDRSRKGCLVKSESCQMSLCARKLTVQLMIWSLN